MESYQPIDDLFGPEQSQPEGAGTGSRGLTELARRIRQKGAYLIHYARGPRQGSAQTTPPVWVIVAKEFESGEETSFALHLTAERLRIGGDLAKHREMLEARMLEEFYGFIRESIITTQVTINMACFVHWGLVDALFGFPAMEQRANVLGLDRIPPIPSGQKIDLRGLIRGLSGGDPSATLAKLARANGLDLRGWVGRTRAKAARDAGDLAAVTRRVSHQVTLLHGLFRLACEGQLRTRIQGCEGQDTINPIQSPRHSSRIVVNIDPPEMIFDGVAYRFSDAAPAHLYKMMAENPRKWLGPKERNTNPVLREYGKNIDRLWRGRHLPPMIAPHIETGRQGIRLNLPEG